MCRKFNSIIEPSPDFSNPILFTDDSGARPVASASLRDEDPKEKSEACQFMRALSKAKTGNQPCAGDIYSLVTDLLSTGVDISLDLYEYCVITGVKPNNIGPGTFIKQQKQSLSNINKIKSISSKVSAYSAIIAPTISVIENAYINYSQGASTQKILWDATVDSSYLFAQASLCIITSLTICSVIAAPVVAPLVCVGASYMICYGMDMIFYDKFALVKTLVK